MSLDVYLTLEGVKTTDMTDLDIFIREDGSIKKISSFEWNLRFPDREPVVATAENKSDEVFWANITHNLNKMAKEAGIYEYLWRPEEVLITKAEQLINPLEMGLSALENDPERFKAYNPSNGWGSYEGLIDFVRRYLKACQQYPEATVRVWR